MEYELTREINIDVPWENIALVEEAMQKCIRLMYWAFNNPEEADRVIPAPANLSMQDVERLLAEYVDADVR